MGSDKLLDLILTTWADLRSCRCHFLKIYPGVRSVNFVSYTESIHVPARRINEIVHGMRGITADTAIRLSRYFGTSAELWLGLQADYDLERAKESLAEVEILPLAA